MKTRKQIIVREGIIKPADTAYRALERGISYLADVRDGKRTFCPTQVRFWSLTSQGNPDSSRESSFLFYTELPRTIESRKFSCEDAFFPGNNGQIPDRQHLTVYSLHGEPTEFAFVKESLLEYALKIISRKAMSRNLQEKLPAMLQQLMSRGNCSARFPSWQRLVEERYSQIKPELDSLN